MDAIEVHQLTKRYGSSLAVDDLSFTVEPGKVTGFLGPNGAGKSTTMRMIVGLDRPDNGWAHIGGKPYRDIANPLRSVGALLEAKALHPGRSAREHLRYLAASQGIAFNRVDELLELVGIANAADRRVGGFSLGMGQRLGVAVALLGDPGVVILDEPVNGLDVDGVRWIRELLRSLAQEGRTVLLSSHLLAEVSVTADHLVVIQRGRLVADCPTEQLTAADAGTVLVVAPQRDELAQVLTKSGAAVEVCDIDSLVVSGMRAAQIGDLALAARLAVHQLTPRQTSLEDAFLELTESIGSTS
ncbi:MAG TPA: ABC transporter ATP-binding protein [Mycobacteriales bacterium]|jgi:ABC-2 type transport system ATP-binding protein|nr:ABC transporter ATP-binding protein [Mycobacteriales bacterium]